MRPLIDFTNPYNTLNYIDIYFTNNSKKLSLFCLLNCRKEHL